MYSGDNIYLKRDFGDKEPYDVYYNFKKLIVNIFTK